MLNRMIISILVLGFIFITFNGCNDKLEMQKAPLEKGLYKVGNVISKSKRYDANLYLKEFIVNGFDL